MLSAHKYTYQVYGLIISSEFEIKELKPCDPDSEIDIEVRFADLGLLNPNAKPDFSFSDDRQIIVLPAVGAFAMEGLSTVLVEPKPGVSDDFLAVPLLGPVLAIALHLRRKFILHGSAIIYDGKAYGFVGDKGAGKSTLAAMLLKNSDVDFLTDDLFVISQQLEALRGYPQMKLSDEALGYSDRRLGTVRPPPMAQFPKNQFLLDTHLPDEPVPIGGIFELRRASEASIANLTPAEAIRNLLRFSYIARFTDRAMSQHERQDLFKTTTLIAATGRVKRLFVPERIGDLDQVIRTIQTMSVS